MVNALRIGVILNPIAGSGGPSARKGSDDLSAAETRLAIAEGRAAMRLQRCLSALSAQQDFEFFAFAGAMGADAVSATGFECKVVGSALSEPSTAADTVIALKALVAAGIDLLLFVGGDGTARDICSAAPPALPVLGVPAGVKMHSGVFAISPEAAAEIITALAEGKLIDFGAAEVRDIDEAAFREGRVISRHFGELAVPRLGEFLQHTKQGGLEVEALAVADIAADIVSLMQPGELYIVGPGSTTAGIMQELGLPNTLLGVDVVCDETLVAGDVDEKTLLGLLKAAGGGHLIVTAIGGQGHILGRGNQQLSPEVLRLIGRDNITVVATKTKIKSLAGRPLLVDSNDLEVDAWFSGLIEVVTGYRDRVLYPVAQAALLR